MFKNLSIFARLIILTAVMMLALLVNILISWSGFQIASASIKEVYFGSVDEISSLSHIRTLIGVNIIDSVQKLRIGKITWKEAENNVREAISKIDSMLAVYMKNIKDENAVNIDQATLTQTEELQRQINNSRPALQKLLNVLEHQDAEGFDTFINNELYSATDSPRSQINQLVDTYVKNTKKDYEEALASIDSYKKFMILIFIIALIISFLISWLITRSITKPLSKAIDSIKKVSLGNLNDIEADYQSNNEIGHLNEAMHHMVDADKRIVEALSKLTRGDLNITVQPRSEQDALTLALVTMANKLKQMIGSIQEDVVSLTNSSKEIVASVSQVAISSSETATAVTETTTTVEELKQTAQISAEKAKDVLTSAEDTLRVVKESEKSLQSTIADMNQINEKMRTISEGIIKLSELGQTIGEIIDTVNDLAEQSNLLAVNAAIEAAKAGEQGKGFGVVAQEIRTLSEQSKAATIQVRAILNDIQNATSAAVLATEQGSKAVEKGVNQSSQTNESMRALLMSMGHVTQAANQISISSQQQLIGVDQVNLAMNNINEATTQHIDNMQKIENTVNAFNAIGQTLKQITDQYITESQKKN